MLTKLNQTKLTLKKNKNPEDKPTIEIISLLIAEMKNTAISLKKPVENLTDTEVEKIVNKISKNLDKEKESLVKANRNTDYVNRQIEFISTLKPKKKSLNEAIEVINQLLAEGKSKKDLFGHFKGNKDFEMAEVSKYINSLK